MPQGVLEHPILENSPLDLESLLLLGAVLVFSLLLRSRHVLGTLGEARLARAIRRAVATDEHVTLHDLPLPFEDGTTQIDHVVLSRYGVFVIETKNMSGWIFGSERDAKWTQTLGRRKFQFQNPLRQKRKHGRAIQTVLGLSQDQMHEFVVFVGSARQKTQVPPNVFFGARRFARHLASFTSQVFTPEQVTSFADRLKDAALAPGRATRRRHVKYVREKAKKRKG